MLGLSLRWWYEQHELEAVILAIGLVLSLAQTFRPALDRAEAQRLSLDVRQKLQAAFPRSEIDWQHAVRRPMEQ